MNPSENKSNINRLRSYSSSVRGLISKWTTARYPIALNMQVPLSAILTVLAFERLLLGSYKTHSANICYKSWEIISQDCSYNNIRFDYTSYGNVQVHIDSCQSNHSGPFNNH